MRSGMRGQDGRMRGEVQLGQLTLRGPREIAIKKDHIHQIRGAAVVREAPTVARVVFDIDESLQYTRGDFGSDW